MKLQGDSVYINLVVKFSENLRYPTMDNFCAYITYKRCYKIIHFLIFVNH